MTKANYTGKEERGDRLFLRDIYAVKILRDNRNRDYLLKIISAALGMDYEELSREYQIVDIRTGLSNDKVGGEADTIIESDEFFINVEVNFSYRKNYTDNKNMSYICSLILRQLDKGNAKKSYEEMKKIRQININNYDRFKDGKFIYTSVLKEVDSNKTRDELIKIIDINLDFLSDIDYTTIKKYDEGSLERLLYVFVCNNRSVLNEVYLEDEIMKRIKGQLYDLSENIDDYLFYDHEEFRNHALYAAGKDDGKEEGFKEGHKSGIEEGSTNERVKLIKSFSLVGVPIEQISEATKLTTEQIIDILRRQN